MPDNSKWSKKYFYYGLTAFLVIAASIAFFWVLSQWSGMKAAAGVVISALSPIIWGCVIAYLLNTPMKLLEKHMFTRLTEKIFRKSKKISPTVKKRITRIASIIVTIALFLGALCGLIALVFPQVIDSIRSIVINIPNYVDEISDLLTRFLEDKPEFQTYVDNVLNKGADFIEKWVDTNIIQQVDKIIADITGGIFVVLKGFANMIIGIVISIYLLYHKEKFGAQAKKIVCGIFKPKYANAIVSAVEFLDKSCGGFISGKILDSLIIAVICYISMLILKMPYAALIAVIVGVTNIIPFFGPFIGAIPSAFLIVFISPVKCLIFIVYIIVLQQIDGNIIGPKILGNTIGLSGFWIMFAILFFGSLCGFWGMLLGVPVFSVIYAGIKKLVGVCLKKRNMPLSTAEYANMDYIDPETKQIVKNSVQPARAGEKSGGKSETGTDDSEDK